MALLPALAFALVGPSLGCTEAPTAAGPRTLTAVAGPARLLLGSPLRLQGKGLAGATLRLEGAAIMVRARSLPALLAAEAGGEAPPGADDAPDEVMDAHVVAVDGAATGAAQALARACLEGADGDGACVDVFGMAVGPLPPLPAPLLRVAGGAGADTGALALVEGAAVEVHGDGLPLAGEGTAWIELAAGAAAGLPTAVTAALFDVAGSRTLARARAARAWLPSDAGDDVVDVRARLWRRVGAAAAEVGPWSEPRALRVAVAPLWAACPPAGCALRRGRASAFGATSCADGAAIALRGRWWLGGAVVADWRSSPVPLPLRRRDDASCWAWLPSLTALGLPVATLPRGARFEGEAVAMAALAAAEPAAGQTLAIALVREPDRQALVVRWDASAVVGLARFGLQGQLAALRTRVLELVAAAFAGLALDAAEERPEDAIEALQIGIFGDDANGFGLLGLDPTPGKDVGNRDRGERLDGLSRAALRADEPAWGGVFVASFLRFSPTLQPGGAQVDARFDGLFAPFAPALGGSPAAAGDASAALQAACEALAQLIAGTLSHEAGHALGLAAGTTALHHEGDHPRWRMDAGPARPFDERAALDGAGEIWGPLDAAALAAALPP